MNEKNVSAKCLVRKRGMVFALAWPPLLVVGCYQEAGEGAKTPVCLIWGETMKRLRKGRFCAREGDWKKSRGPFSFFADSIGGSGFEEWSSFRGGFTATKRLAMPSNEIGLGEG
ncbi:MAG: hypothetical protein CM1200mP4_3700 [Rhodospirillaceae bacterium]|nr:MAG: hypothetical protein CM1200mP4_3700 [Rhodospirillaceae bacterium]